MNSVERIDQIFNGTPDRSGFWMGNPTDETKEIYYNHFGISIKSIEGQNSGYKHRESDVIQSGFSGEEDLEIAIKVNSDFVWYCPEVDPRTWKHPEGKPMFDVLGGKERTSLSEPGVFAECEDVKDIECFEWPNPDYIDFTPVLANVEKAKENRVAVAGGMWMPFFHLMCDFFGMENYFIKMYADPKVVEAATEYIVGFYLEANKRCLELMGDKIDIVFFGNDLGSQQDLLISEECFDKFILPYQKKLIEQAKSYNKKVMLHSCGAISRIIPKLIDAGVDALHPIQAKAHGMDAETLAREYKNQIVFVGGVDTQHLLLFGTPQEIKDEVYRLRELFGDKYIVSPSHEALLPNVSVENFMALCEAAVMK